ncbi:hypothetical protein NX90_09015 [Neisseria meningitidis]|nr:hypothetical protein NX90_09015 [Neisseria meningitidis]
MGVGRSVFQTASLGKAYAAFSIVIPSPPTRGQAVAGIQNVELTKPVFPCQSSILTGLDSACAGMTVIREAVFYRGFRVLPCDLPPSATGQGKGMVSDLMFTCFSDDLFMARGQTHATSI